MLRLGRSMVTVGDRTEVHFLRRAGRIQARGGQTIDQLSQFIQAERANGVINAGDL